MPAIDALSQKILRFLGFPIHVCQFQDQILAAKWIAWGFRPIFPSRYPPNSPGNLALKRKRILLSPDHAFYRWKNRGIRLSLECSTIQDKSLHRMDQEMLLGGQPFRDKLNVGLWKWGSRLYKCHKPMVLLPSNRIFMPGPNKSHSPKS